MKIDPLSVFYLDLKDWPRVSLDEMTSPNPPIQESIEENTLKLMIDLPGFKPINLKVTHESNLLRITGSRSGTRKLNYVYTPPKGFDLSTTKAYLEDGVLYLQIQRSITDPVRTIEIERR